MTKEIFSAKIHVAVGLPNLKLAAMQLRALRELPERFVFPEAPLVLRVAGRLTQQLEKQV